MASSTLVCGVCDLADITQNLKFSNAFCDIEQSVAELSDNIHRIQNNRENNLKMLTEMKKQIEEEIKQTRITVNKHLDTIQDDIVTKLNATEEQEKEPIIDLLDLLKENESDLIKYQKNIEYIKKYATDIQIFLSVKVLEKNVSIKDKFLQSVIDSENFKDHELSYNTNAAMKDLANCIKDFGEVKIETKPCDVVLTRRKNKQAQIMLPHILSKSVEEVNIKLLKTMNTRRKYISGCCMLPDGKMAFTDHVRSTVTVFKSNGSKYFKVNTPSMAFDIAYSHEDNTLAVTSGMSLFRCITIIDIQNKQIKKEISVDSCYYGIAVNEGKAICSAVGRGIQLINLHNNQTSDIVRDEMPEWCCVATLGNKIYHTNHHTNSVTFYDMHGTVQWIFKNEGVLNSPRGISVDNDGNVYVVGYNSTNVVVIYENGQQHNEILTARDGLYKPVSLDYNRNTNHFLVANYSKKAMIFTRT